MAEQTKSEAAPEEEERVKVVTPDGRRGTLPASELENAVSQGYKLQPGEEAPFGFDTIDAALTGAARGATLGLSDVMAKSLGTARPEELEALKELHPVATGAGEIAGMAVSPVGKLGAGIREGIGATTLAGRVGANMLAGAAEGSLYGAGNAVSESVLGNQQLTAEKLLAAGGLGAVLGAGGGGMGELLNEGVSKGAEAAADAVSGAQSKLKSFANSRWNKAGGAIQSDIKKLSPIRRDEMANVFREHIPANGNLADAFESIQNEHGQMGQRIGDLVKEADAKPREMEVLQGPSTSEKPFEPIDIGQETSVVQRPALKAPKTGPIKIQRNAEGMYGKEMVGVLPDQEPEMPKAFEPIDINKSTEVLQGPASSAKPFEPIQVRRPFDGSNIGSGVLSTADQLERDAVEGDIKALRNAFAQNEQAGGTFGGAHQIIHTLGERANWKYAPDTDPVKNRLLKELYHEARGEFEKQLAPQLGSDSAKEFLDVSKRYSTLSDALGVARRGLDRMEGNRYASASDYLTGMGMGMLHGGPMGIATGLASAFGHKLVRERGSSVVARLADAISDSPVLKTVADHFAGALQQSGKTALFGKFGPILANAAGESAQHALATHLALSADFPKEYGNQAALAGFPKEAPDQTGPLLEKAHGLNMISGAGQDFDANFARAVGHVIHGGKDTTANPLASQDFGSKAMRRDTPEAYAQRRAEIQQLAVSPDMLAERIGANLGPIGSVAPNTAAAMTATATRAVQFLHSKLPNLQAAAPLAPQWVPSRSEIDKFTRYLQATEDPMSVLRQAADGHATPEAIEALKTVWPRLYGQLGPQIAAGLANRKGATIPYERRVHLSLVTGTDMDGTMSPRMVQSLQAVYNRPKSQAPQGGGKPTKAGAAKITLASRSRTTTQAAEDRGTQDTQ